MKKILIATTIGLLCAVFLSSQNTGDAMTGWLVSESAEYQVIRIAVIGLLFGLLFSKPPRQVWFRSLIGVSGAMLAVSSFVMMMSYQMHILDMMLFVEVAIILIMETLEDTPLPAKGQKKVTQM